MPGFPSSVRDQVLVESARHCAVCHRFKALGVEVHHIVPSSEGGANSEENAIALCFDCHAAAGHYNPQHPKGSRYSREELRRAKATWKRTVSSGLIVSPPDCVPPLVTCRHVVTSDGTAVDDVIRLNNVQLPFGYFELLQLDVALAHIRECFAQERLFTGYMGSRSYTGVLGGSSSSRFQTAEEFHKANPHFRGAETRPLNADDTRLLQRQSVWLKAVREGVDPAHVGRVLAVGGPGCGDDSWHEEVAFRVPHAVFMQIRNDSAHPIKVQAIVATSSGTPGRVDFRPLLPPGNQLAGGTIEIAPTTILPGNSLLVPEGVLYGPLEDAWFRSESSDQYAGSVESSELKIQSFVYDPDALESKNFFVTGTWVHVQGVVAATSQGSQHIDVHPFDPAKPFVSINTVWLAGSCPHVFFRDTSGRWLYGGEVLVDAFGPDRSSCVACSIPDDVSTLRVSELEYETTTLDWICLDGEQVIGHTLLERGQWIELPVRPGQRVTMQGHYRCGTSSVHDPWYAVQKRRLLEDGLHELSAIRAVCRFGSIWTTEPALTERA